MLVAPTFRSGNKWNEKNSFGGIFDGVAENHTKTKLINTESVIK